MLLLDQGKFGCRRASGLRSFLLLAVENQTGDEIASKSDQLGIPVMATVFGCFFAGEIDGIAAIAAASSEATVYDKPRIASPLITEDRGDKGLGVCACRRKR